MLQPDNRVRVAIQPFGGEKFSAGSAAMAIDQDDAAEAGAVNHVEGSPSSAAWVLELAKLPKSRKPGIMPPGEHRKDRDTERERFSPPAPTGSRQVLEAEIGVLLDALPSGSTQRSSRFACASIIQFISATSGVPLLRGFRR